MSQVNVLADKQKIDWEGTQYVLGVMGTYLGVRFRLKADLHQAARNDEMHIQYGHCRGNSANKVIRIPCDTSLFECRERSVFLAEAVPVLCVEKKAKTLFSWTEDGVYFHYDIFSTCFYLLSRFEESRDIRRDQWDCYSGKFTELSRLGILDFPLINGYASLLAKLLEEVFPNKFVFSPVWPAKKRFAVALIHDVDQPFKGDIHSGLRLVKRFLTSARGIKTSFKLIHNDIHRRLRKTEDPYYNFQKYVDLEKDYGFSSAFHFASGGIRQVRFDTTYSLENTRMRQAIEFAKSESWSIGLHASFHSAFEKDTLMREKTKLEEISGCPVLGLTQHYLHLRPQETWSVQASCGFVYDCSLGYNEAVGFRAGAALPFYPFNQKQKRPYSLLEIPLAIMDSALFTEMQLDYQQALQRCIRLLSRVKEYSGAVAIIWHLRVLDEKTFPQWGRLYREILKWLDRQDAWVTCPDEIARWWKVRAKGLN